MFNITQAEHEREFELFGVNIMSMVSYFVNYIPVIDIFKMQRWLTNIDYEETGSPELTNMLFSNVIVKLSEDYLFL